MEIALILLITQIILVWVYLFGGIISRSFRLDQKPEMDLAPAIGLFLTICIWAAMITSFSSITELILIIGGLGGIYLYRVKKIRFSTFELPSMSGLLVLLLFGLSWNFILGAIYVYYQYGHDSVIPPHHDLLYYAKVSEMIFRTGQENPFGVLNLHLDVGNVPYHYFELYLLQFFHNSFVSGTAGILIGVPAVFLSIISWLLWKNLFNGLSYWTAFGISIMILFVSGLTLPLPLDEVGAFSDNLLVSCVSKNAVITLPLVCAFITFKNSRDFTPLLFVWLLPIMTFALLPSVMGVTLLVILYAAIRKKRGWSLMLIIWVSILVFISMFYLFTGASGDYGLPMPALDEVLQDLVNHPFTKIKHYIALHIYYWLDYVIFVPVFVLFLGNGIMPIIRRYWEGLVFSLLFVSIGFFGWVLLFGHSGEAWQVYYYNSAIGSNVLIWSGFALLVKLPKKRIVSFISLGALSLFGVFSFISNSWSYDQVRFDHVGMSRSFYSECLNDLKGETSLFAYSEYELRKPEIYPVGNLFYLSREIDVYNLHEEIIQAEQGPQKQSWIYHRFKDSEDLSLGEKYNLFLTESKTSYLITRGEPLPVQLAKYFDLMRTDSKNGYQFYQLKK